jgi:hypothetical protein
MGSEEVCARACVRACVRVNLFVAMHVARCGCLANFRSTHPLNAFAIFPSDVGRHLSGLRTHVDLRHPFKSRWQLLRSVKYET